MTAAMATVQSYPIACQHCGETIAVRTQAGQLRVLGAFTVESHGRQSGGSRLQVTCPECKRMTRVRAQLGVSDNRP